MQLNPMAAIIRGRASSLIERIRMPAALLAALLQRTPAARLALAAADYGAESTAGAVLRAFTVSAAVLGAVDSVAGASSSGGGVSATATLVADIPLPTAIIAGQAFKMDVTVTGPAVTFAKSWDVTDTLPPGIKVQGATLVGSLWVINDATAVNGILTISGTATQAGLYKFTLEAWQNTNRSGSVTTGTSSINVSAPSGSIPKITTEPLSQVVNAGSPVTMSVVATATQALTYIWYKNDTLVVGATGATLSIPSAQASDAGTYSVIVTSPGGSVQSQAATLVVNVVNAAPSFSLEPASLTVSEPSTVVFDALASGTPSPSYQWSFNGTPIPGATSPVLLIEGATSANAGSYACAATNSLGTATSSAATLGVIATQDIGRLVNLSCRAVVGTGTNIMTAGFVVGGSGVSGAQSVLVRGSGPALGIFGLTGLLADPKLTLNNTSPGGGVVASDTGWAGNSSIEAEAALLGAFSWGSAATADSALLQALPPDNYTAQIAGAAGDTGLALIEVYDATPSGSYTLATPRLVNLSALIQDGSGPQAVAAGFVIGGTTARTVLIRASGPALGAAPFDFPGALSDPQLTLTNTSVSPNQVVKVDTGWGGDPTIAEVAASVGAFGWSSSSADSAILATLPPGNYTAGVAGASGDKGLVLIELYEVP
jgi:hypothetical protein